MKNVCAKLLILFVITGTAYGQGFRFGIQGSPTLNYTSTNDPDAETGSRLLFNFGLLSEFNFAEQYGLSTGVNIVQRGGKLTPNANGSRSDTIGNYKAGFVQVPIRLKMRTREFGYFTYFAEFGGSVDVRINENVDFDPEIQEVNRLDSYVKAVNFMFSIGLGTQYSFGGSTSALVGLYYNRSLLDNVNNKTPGLEKDYNYRFDYVALQLGILF